ncbi:MAG: hypothetical protein K8F32_06575 [Rhodocyclaceae bacterium]|nr:hypothetical protein [Rhodocyclaceae bacterium]
MNSPKSRTDQIIATTLAVVMTAFFITFGWYGLFNGGISLPNKLEHRVIYIVSDGITGFGVLSFFFATLTISLVVQNKKRLLLCLLALWVPFMVFLLAPWHQ